MNQLSQQPVNFQGQQGFQNQVPTGFVQSHYQGQLSQPSFGRQSNSIISNMPGGFQGQNMYSQQGTQQFVPTSYTSMSQPVGTYNSFISHQPVQSHAQSPATAFGSVGPVIAHVGYQAGTGSQQSFYQPSAANFGTQYAQQHTASNYGGFAQSNAQSGYGMTPTQSYTTSQNPVYEATNAYQQAGPVISHVGGWQATNAQNSPYSGGMR